MKSLGRNAGEKWDSAMTVINRPAIFVIICLGLIPMAHADFGSPFVYYQCDKYCNVMCTNTVDVRPSEFRDCVLANLNCNCQNRYNLRNRIVMLIIGIFALMLMLTICGCCYRLCSGHNGRMIAPGHAIVANPMVSTISGGITNPAATVNHTSRRAPRAFIVPLSPQKSNDLPPEYLPPPPYHECVIDINSQQKT